MKKKYSWYDLFYEINLQWAKAYVYLLLIEYKGDIEAVKTHLRKEQHARELEKYISNHPGELVIP